MSHDSPAVSAIKTAKIGNAESLKQKLHEELKHTYSGQALFHFDFDRHDSEQFLVLQQRTIYTTNVIHDSSALNYKT